MPAHPLRNEPPVSRSADHDLRPQLNEELRIVSEKCISCPACQKECEFLRKYGRPKDLADAYDPNDPAAHALAFECSLCGLCGAVCPVDIHPVKMFTEMRREAVRRGAGEYPEHAGMLNYQKRGTSKRYSYYALPAGCTTVLFPGCNFPGTRPSGTKQLFKQLQLSIPTLGIVLDCCAKPSADLGREDLFRAMFGELKDYLLSQGIKEVLVACPNCYRVFSQHGGDLAVKSVYEVLDAQGACPPRPVNGTVIVHDPCPTRFEGQIHTAVRRLLARTGLTIEERPHHGSKTLCCGEGGAVGCLAPDLAGAWKQRVKAEAGDKRLVTYCAGCAHSLDQTTPTSHILDVWFEPEAALAGKSRVSRAPLTYLNRIRLKHHFKQTVAAAVTRERTFSFDPTSRPG
ncbi:MAG: (Fe-S)-binding protein, partial [Deltaproteobacteria bacterium]|nr:(Fe-S)-binding protein [Deltaproteobacteria bacterium]